MMRPSCPWRRACLPWFLLLFIRSAVSNRPISTPEEDMTLDQPTLLRARRLQWNTNCRAERKDFPTELQLYYVFDVEFQASMTAPSLAGMETLIASSLAIALADDCDLLDRPRYQLQPNMRHRISPNEFCIAEVDGNSCRVVYGATAIWVDGNKDSSDMFPQKVYNVIARALVNQELMSHFVPNVERAKFQNALPESWIVLSNPSGSSSSTPITAAVIVAAASVSLVVASIFGYGLVRREIRRHPQPSIRHKLHRSARKMVPHPMGIAPKRRFVKLEEGEANEEDFAEFDENYEYPIEHPQFTPSTTWSVSDMTSESASTSVPESLSTSRLERIEEAEDEEDIFDDYYYIHRNRKRAHRKHHRRQKPRRNPRTDLTTTNAPCAVLEETSNSVMAEAPLPGHKALDAWNVSIDSVMPDVGDDLLVSSDEDIYSVASLYLEDEDMSTELKSEGRENASLEYDLETGQFDAEDDDALLTNSISRSENQSFVEGPEESQEGKTIKDSGMVMDVMCSSDNHAAIFQASMSDDDFSLERGLHTSQLIHDNRESEPLSKHEGPMQESYHQMPTKPNSSIEDGASKLEAKNISPNQVTKEFVVTKTEGSTLNPSQCSDGDLNSSVLTTYSGSQLQEKQVSNSAPFPSSDDVFRTPPQGSRQDESVDTSSPSSKVESFRTPDEQALSPGRFTTRATEDEDDSFHSCPVDPSQSSFLSALSTRTW